ncbi:MAG: hypothetical protein ACREYE_29865 [Gammaproteobacteria bacterium]
MSETIAITGKSVKLFKGHYTRDLKRGARQSIAARTGALRYDGRALWQTIRGVAGGAFALRK